MSIAEKLVTIAENQERVYEAGKNSVENYLLYSSTAKFENLNLFGKADVVINIPLLSGSLTNMFKPGGYDTKYKNRIVEHITVNSEAQPTRIDMMFYFAEPWDNVNPLRHITLNFDTSKSTTFHNFISGLYNLEIVDGMPLDFSSVPSDYAPQFGQCPKLAYIRFVPNTIKCSLNTTGSQSLTNDSIQSIIDGLVDLTGATTRTLSFHATVGAKLTEAQKATITAKNWTLVY